MGVMFIAVRDLRFATGRFSLLAGVIALMTFMVVMLGGLTAGLGAASVSAVDKLPVDAIAFQRPAAGQDVSFTTSNLPARTVEALAAAAGVTAAHPIGISTIQLRSSSSTVAVTLIGTDPSMFPALELGAQPGADEIALTAALADEQHLHVGDGVQVAGRSLKITSILADASFNHLPAAYTDIDTWQQLTHNDTITAVGLRLKSASVPALDRSADVSVIGKDAAFDAVGAYSSEQGSLNLMRGLLVAVSVLIVGSFFTVWTMQRAGDLAVVRAIGGSRGYLLRDALGQAVIVLLVGAGVGASVAISTGLLVTRLVPFVLTVPGVLVPLAAMVGVGLLGASLSVRKVTTVDPLAALGAAR